jgi:hypothetical protein
LKKILIGGIVAALVITGLIVAFSSLTVENNPNPIKDKEIESEPIATQTGREISLDLEESMTFGEK